MINQFLINCKKNVVSWIGNIFIFLSITLITYKIMMWGFLMGVCACLTMIYYGWRKRDAAFVVFNLIFLIMYINGIFMLVFGV